MIIIDFSQVAISNVLRFMTESKTTSISADDAQHLILNSIKRLVTLGKKQSPGQVFIALDSKGSWRKEYFPYYKANRGVTRAKSPYDWKTIYTAIDQVVDGLRNHFPYHVLQIEKAEADDIIAVVSKAFTEECKGLLIISGDGDFVQLHNTYITQYSPVLNKKVVGKGNRTEIKQHILTGDRNDGVPNVLSADDVFVAAGRQKTMRSNMLDDLMAKDPKEYDPIILKNWVRNERMISLDMIPDEIVSQITEQFVSVKNTTKPNNVFNYLFKIGSKHIKDAGDF